MFEVLHLLQLMYHKALKPNKLNLQASNGSRPAASMVP